MNISLINHPSSPILNYGIVSWTSFDSEMSNRPGLPFFGFHYIVRHHLINKFDQLVVTFRDHGKKMFTQEQSR